MPWELTLLSLAALFGAFLPGVLHSSLKDSATVVSAPQVLLLPDGWKALPSVFAQTTTPQPKCLLLC